MLLSWDWWERVGIVVARTYMYVEERRDRGMKVGEWLWKKQQKKVWETTIFSLFNHPQFIRSFTNKLFSLFFIRMMTTTRGNGEWKSLILLMKNNHKSMEKIKFEIFKWKKCVSKVGVWEWLGNACPLLSSSKIYMQFFLTSKKLYNKKIVRHYTDAHKKIHFNFQQIFRVFMPNSSSLTHGETQNEKITFQQKITRQPLVNLIKWKIK